MATTYTVTTTFSANTTAIASEVNQNFTDVLTALNSFDATNLTGTIALARISDLTSTQMASAFFKDEDDMSSNLDTAVASQQSVKAYADTVAAAAMTPTSYAGEESVTHANGQIVKSGHKADSGSATTTVTFAVAFPNGIVSAMVVGVETSSGSVAFIDDAGGISTTTIVMRRSGSLAGGFYWEAKGW